MLVAFWTVHRNNGFYIVASGWEYNLVLAVIGTAFAVSGAGRLSLDSAIWGGAGALNGWIGLLIILVLGVGGAAVHLAVFYRPAKTSSAA
jgi:putative oxidoreductase